MGCLSYKTWSLVMGWLSLVTAAVFGFFITFPISVLQTETFLAQFLRTRPLEDLRYLSMYITPVLVAELIFAIMLIRGVHQQRRKLIAPYIFLNVLYLVYPLVLMGHLITSVIKGGDDFSKEMGSLLDYFLIIVFGLVCLIPVYKFYKQLGQPIILSTNAAERRTVVVNKTCDVRGTAASKV